jgi:hypothetical protein
MPFRMLMTIIILRVDQLNLIILEMGVAVSLVVLALHVYSLGSDGLNSIDNHSGSFRIQ